MMKRWSFIFLFLAGLMVWAPKSYAQIPAGAVFFGTSPTALTPSGSTISLNATAAANPANPWFTVTLTGNDTVNVSNMTAGGNYKLFVKQPSSGGPYTLTLGTGCTWVNNTLAWSTTASTVDLLAWWYDGTYCYAVQGPINGTPDGTAFSALTDGATVTWAVGGGVISNKTLTFTTHGGSRTLNLTGLASGGNYVLKLVQDSSGTGEGLTLGSGCTWLVSVTGSGFSGSTVTPVTTANGIDVLAFTYDGTNCLATFN